MSQTSSSSSSPGRLRLYDVGRVEQSNDFAEDVRTGLTSDAKKLPPKYLYDELGSQLFEAICLVPEYYPTRAENEILELHSDEIVASIEGPKTLLEMGSGSASKTRCIIEAILKQQPELLFVPVDISVTALENSSRVLLQSYPELRIEGYAGDYYDGLEALHDRPEGTRTLALFLGSNIGNFDEDESHRFLRAMRRILRAGDGLLLGADLKKDPAVLEAAYDDALGVTAAFNLNLLVRINRELDANFDLHQFRHYTVFNQDAGRIESYIESLREQTIRIEKLDLNVQVGEGERIHTENSYKYDLEGLARMASKNGFKLTRTWLDRREQFSSNLFVAGSAGGSPAVSAKRE